MTTSKQKRVKIDFDSNKVIYGCLAWIIGWFVIANMIDAGMNSGQLVLIAKIPIVIGSFCLAYLLGLKTKDKIGLITVTLLFGFLLSYLFSIPFETYKGFVLIFTNHSIY